MALSVWHCDLYTFGSYQLIAIVVYIPRTSNNYISGKVSIDNDISGNKRTNTISGIKGDTDISGTKKEFSVNGAKRNSINV
jgi:hypothetical protein